MSPSSIPKKLLLLPKKLLLRLERVVGLLFSFLDSLFNLEPLPGLRGGLACSGLWSPRPTVMQPSLPSKKCQGVQWAVRCWLDLLELASTSSCPGEYSRPLMAGPAPGRSACRMGGINSSTWKQSCVIKPPKMLFWETQKSKAKHSGNAVLSHRRQRWQEIYKFDHSTHFKVLCKKRYHKCKDKQWAEIVMYIASPGLTSKI